MTDTQDAIIEFISDPETIKKAVEGSMEKRAKVIDLLSLDSDITTKADGGAS